HHIVVRIEVAHDLGDLQRGAARRLGGRRQIERAHGLEARIELQARGSGRRRGFHRSSRACLGGFKPPLPVSYPAMRNPITTVRVLGIDPGSQCTGFGVLDATGPRLAYVASGVIRTQQGEFSVRLCEIFRCVRTVVAQYRPQEIAIERVFVNRNPDSALKLGQARGAAICGTVDANAEIFEYATRQIKQAVVGTGSAEKGQVQLMMRSILKLDGPVAADAADALAAAVCNALRGQVRTSLKLAASRG